MLFRSVLLIFIVYMPHIREGHVVGSARKATGNAGAPAEGT
jgi:hypothetical protein